MIGEKRPSSELLGWSLDLDQPIWKKAFFDEILCLLACMAFFFGWLAAYSPCQGLFPFLSWPDWHPVASPVSKDDEQYSC